ncbi:MAG: aldo/keto reductase [Candidatus Zixiibacteriota bacterium]
MKLGLGTAQFGINYGISNWRLQTPKSEVERILAYADENGVHMIDTAPIYGSAESILGDLLPDHHSFRIVTKTKPCSCDWITTGERSQLKTTFYQSLEKLKQSKLYGLLVHHGDDLLRPGGELLVDALCDLKAEGLVDKIGVSVYTREEIDAIVRMFMPDLVQVPVNMLDQRLIRNGCLEQMAAVDIEIHARSVFLQGLLLMDVEEVPSYFEPIKSHLQALHRELDSRGISRLAAALDFVMRQEEIGTVVVGVAASSELVEIISAAASQPEQGMDYSRWALSESRFLNPSMWEITDRLTTIER